MILYPVADLLALQMRQPFSAKKELPFETDRLAALIGRGIGVQHWRSGQSITGHGNCLSLVVRQTIRGHRELANFLAKMRRVVDGYTVVTIHRLQPDAEIEQTEDGVLSAAQTQALLKPASSTPLGPRVTLNNANAERLEKLAISLNAVPSLQGDRAQLEVVSLETGAVRAQAAAPVGSSLLLPAAPGSNASPLLISIEQIADGDDEEKLLGIPIGDSLTGFVDWNDVVNVVNRRSHSTPRR